MRKEIPVWLAVVIIVVVIAVAGFAYWHFSKPKTPPEVKTLPPSHQPAPMP